MRKTGSIWLLMCFLACVVGFLIGTVVGPFVFERMHDNPKPAIACETKVSNQTTAVKCEKPTLLKGEQWFQSKFGICFAYNSDLQSTEYDNETGRSIGVSYADADNPEILIIFYKSDDLGLKSRNPAKEYATTIAADFKGVKPIETSCPLGIGYSLTTDEPSDIGNGITKHFYVKNGEEILCISSSKVYPPDKKPKPPFERCVETLTACKTTEVN